MGYSMAIDGIQTYDSYHHNLRSEKVCEVLKEYLENDTLRKAMALWENQYSQQPIEKLSFFIFELESGAELKGARRELLKKLEEVLKQDFSVSTKKEPMLQRPKRDLAEATEKSQEQVIDPKALDFFFKNLLVHLSKVKKIELLEVCGEYLDENSLPSFLKEEIVSILVEGAEPIHLTTDAEYISETTNMIYSILCEYFGPVKADKVLAKALEDNANTYPKEDMSKFL